MVRRSKRSAKSEPTEEEGSAQSENVTEEVCSVEQALLSMHSGEGELHSADVENILKDVTCEPLPFSDPVENATKEVGETGDVQAGQSEKETEENKDGMELGNGNMTSGLKDPKANKAAADEVMADGDDEVATAIAEAEKALASESEASNEEQTAVEAADESASEVVDISAEDMVESDEKEAEQCLYCDDSGFSVNDVDAYVAHLENEHRVVRNALLLARNTIDTHRQGMSAGWGGVLYGP